MTQRVSSGPGAHDRASPLRDRRWVDRLHLAGLCSLALAQPTYSLIGAHPQFLTAHAAGLAQIVFVVLGLSVGLPAVLGGITALAAAIGPRSQRAAQSALVWLLACVLAAQVVVRIWPRAGGLAVVALAGATGAVFALIYRRTEALRSFATFLSAATVIVPVTFLLDNDVRALLQDDSADVPVLDATVANPAPLVVVVFDELPLSSLLDRDGLEIDGALFPSFARLAAKSHWFRDATTTGAFTELAIAALHTGRYTESDRFLSADVVNFPRNLFTLLGTTYDVQAFETTTRLVPSGMARVKGRSSRAQRGSAPLLLADVAAVLLHATTPPPWNARLPSVDGGWVDFWRSREEEGTRVSAGPRHRLAELQRFVAALDDGTRPLFVYLHPLFPHWPWEYLPSGRRYFDGALDLPGRGDGWLSDWWPVAQGYQRHRVQVVTADRFLGELLDRLESMNSLDDALVVVLADHGIAFTPGAPRRELLPSHEEILRNEIMPIPLLIKLPRQQAPIVHDTSAEIIDVLPTIADVLGVEIPWPVQGRSLLDPVASDRPRRRVTLEEPFVTIELRDHGFSPVRELARRRNRWFGTTVEGGVDLFRLGPDAHWIGTSIETVAVESVQHRAVLRNEHLLREVAPGDGRIPAFLQGEVIPRGEPVPRVGDSVGIALDGVLQATTRLHRGAKGELAFAALLPEEALAASTARTMVYLLGQGSSLAQLDSTGSQDFLRGAWEAAETSLFVADASTGWEGFTGSAGAVVGVDDVGALVVESTGGVLRLELPRFDAAGADAFLVALELESDVEVTPIVYYMTEDEPVFRLGRMVIARPPRGRGIAFVEVRAEGLLGGLSLDLGRQGSIRVHSIIVRAA
jgi:hypothetical protein